MKTNKQQVGMQAMAFASQLLPAIIGVLSFMLLVRTVKQETLGQYMMYLAAVVLFEMVKSSGLQSAVVMRASGATREQERTITGSAYWLGGIVSICLSVVLAILYFSNSFGLQPGIRIFCGWYSCLGLVTLPIHVAEATAVSKQNIRFLLFLRIAQSANSVLIAVYAYFLQGSLEHYATIHLIFTALLMLVVVISGKTNPLHVKYKTWYEVKELFKLIRYTLATLATTNLLKSADTFLIGTLMGPASVAAYAIPLKLTELFEIPLRSLSTTAFPQLASAYNNRNSRSFYDAFVQYVSWAYMLYFPALIAAFVLAPYLVVILGGAQYASTAAVFRVFLLYSMMLPVDRMTGIGLDAMQKPSNNFCKVAVMALVNIVADIAAIKMTGRLEWIAFASVLNVATGVVLGCFMLKRTGALGASGLGTVGNDCYSYSLSFIKKSYHQIAKLV